MHKFTYGSEERTASIFRVEATLEYGGSMLLQNVGKSVAKPKAPRYVRHQSLRTEIVTIVGPHFSKECERPYSKFLVC